MYKKNKSLLNNKKEVFVFDLDDTLVDGRQFCGETIAKVIIEKDPKQSFEVICNLHTNIRGLTIEDLYIKISKELGLNLEISELLKRDFEIQNENIEKMNIFDGVKEVLDYLSSKRKNLYICTNRKKTLLLKVLEKNGIQKYFKDVISCADEGYKKPNPHCLITLIEKIKVPKEKVIYLGDAEVDAIFANNAGVENIIFDQYLNNKTLFRTLLNTFLI